MIELQHRGVEVKPTACGRDSSPMMVAIDYELIVDTDEDDHRLELLHTNVRKFGTISNAVAPLLSSKANCPRCPWQRHEPRLMAVGHAHDNLSSAMPPSAYAEGREWWPAISRLRSEGKWRESGRRDLNPHGALRSNGFSYLATAFAARLSLSQSGSSNRATAHSLKTFSGISINSRA